MEIDKVLHRERLDGGRKRLHPLTVPIADLPDGAMVRAGDESLLIVAGCSRPWSFGGYCEPRDDVTAVLLLTPPSTLRALQAGYRPVLHPSAQAS